MSADKINVRRKENKKSQKNLTQIFVAFVCAVLICAIGVISFLIFSDRLSFASTEPEIIQNGAGKIIRVPRGGNLQNAINLAGSGDIIELQAGAEYTGNFILPKKNLTDFVTIRSSAISQLPENSRVTPAQAKSLAKLAVKKDSRPLVLTEPGAHHFRFDGIEFSSESPDYIYNLVFFGDEEKGINTPHHFEINRSYLHSTKTGKTRRAITANGANITIQNSYIEGFAFPGEETQAILGYTGTKDLKILNNYIEGGAENIMFGGAEAANAELVPSDIQIRGNHFNKPAEWKTQGAAMKCLFEIKAGKRIQFVENYLENNWVGAAFRLTLRSEDGKAPFHTIEDVLIKDNIVSGAGDGIQILGKDDFYDGKPNQKDAQTLKRLTIENNLFLNIGAKEFEGSGFFVQTSDGEQITIANNTSFNEGNSAKFYGVMPKNFVFKNNIIGHGEYGVHGLESVKSPTAQKMFTNNVFVNNRNVQREYMSYPPNNFTADSYVAIGFANMIQNDFRLSPKSKFKGRGEAQKDVGSNLSFDITAKAK